MKMKNGRDEERVEKKVGRRQRGGGGRGGAGGKGFDDSPLTWCQNHVDVKSVEPSLRGMGTLRR